MKRRYVCYKTDMEQQLTAEQLHSDVRRIACDGNQRFMSRLAGMMWISWNSTLYSYCSY